MERNQKSWDRNWNDVEVAIGIGVGFQIWVGIGFGIRAEIKVRVWIGAVVRVVVGVWLASQDFTWPHITRHLTAQAVTLFTQPEPQPLTPSKPPNSINTHLSHNPYLNLNPNPTPIPTTTPNPHLNTTSTIYSNPYPFSYFLYLTWQPSD